MRNVKLFGEYLIEKGIIDEGTLVDALVEQIRSLPSTAEVVWTQKLLKPADVLNVFKCETQNGASFVDAARSLDCWNDALDASVKAHLKKVRVPLGQILVSRGALS